MWRTRPGAPYPPYIWVGYEGCRSARAFETRLRGASESKNRDRSVTGQPAWAYEAGLRGPAIDALKSFAYSQLYCLQAYCHPRSFRIGPWISPFYRKTRSKLEHFAGVRTVAVYDSDTPGQAKPHPRRAPRLVAYPCTFWTTFFKYSRIE